MHEESPLNILAHTDNGYIGLCDCCHEYNFVYKNILLAFQREELTRFLDWLIAYRTHDDTYLPLPHGRTRVYRSPLSNLFLAFHEEELDEVTQLFAEAQLILEARSLLADNS
jgi:hypothetical protein